jgi:amino acid adenylation domain-containing protein
MGRARGRDDVTDVSRRIAALSPRQIDLLLRELQRTEGSAVERIGDGPGARAGDGVPLSFAQERVWFLEQLQPGTAAYNIAAAVRLTGALDVAALQASVGEVIRRHDALRTRIDVVDGQPRQRVEAPAALGVRVVDIGALPDGARARAVRAVAATEARRPFDLARGPLVRVTVLRLGAREHVAFLTLHHIVADAWSVGIVIHEIATVYRAVVRGVASPLPSPRLQYGEYAAWQRHQRHGEALERGLAYWRRQLAGVPTTLALPTDHPRPAVQSFRGARHRAVWPAPITRAVKGLCQREGVTLFMTLLAGFQALLARYSAQDDIAVGSPIANRTRPETEGVVGFFANTLVLRTRLGGAPTFRELLARVREVALGAYAHQDVPFELVVDALGPARALGHHPVFQVMLVLQNAPTAAIDLPGVRLSPMSVESGAVQFDLVLIAAEVGDTLSMTLDYSTDLFDPDTAVRLLDHLRAFLEAAVTDSAEPIASVPLLTASERSRLTSWNATDAEFPGPECVHELFADQAARTPDFVAVTCGGRHLTYRELDHQADRLAAVLRHAGVAAEVPVGVSLHRSLDLVVAVWGVLKAGGAYVPLDPASPRPHLARIVADAGIRVVLTEEALSSRTGDLAALTLCLDRPWPPPSPGPQRLRGVATADHLAYEIFTSGSTGAPKGVMVTHGALRNHMLWLQATYPLAASDAVLHKTPIAFDVSLLELLWPFLVGARLVMAPVDAHRDPAALVRLIRDERVTTVYFVASVLPVFLEEDGVESCRSLRRVFCGGEALTPDTRDLCLRRLDAALCNIYGPTETCIDVTSWDCRTARDAPRVPIGHPIANAQVHVLDPRLEPVPVGIVGEICVGGVPLARGYCNRPELTAERFVPEPHGHRPGARLYRTGDLGRRRSDGALEFVGRRDGQVKVRGFRIELGEIEQALERHPDVRQAVVVVHGRESADQRLVAFVGRHHGRPPIRSADLMVFLKGMLAAHLVPAAIAELEAFPVTASGKVDRRALAAIEVRTVATDGHVAPRTATEGEIAAVWRDVLGRGQVGINDNFFDLGGTSLLMVQARSRLSRVLGRPVSLVDLFEFPTVRTLAEHVLGGTDAGVRAEAMEDRARARRAALDRLAEARGETV